MMKLICVGKVKKDYVKLGIEEFLKRLTKYTKMEYLEVNSIEEKHLKGFIIALDVHGKEYPSEKFAENLSFTQAVARIPARNALYSYMHHYQHQLSPDKLQQHRAYFKQDSRGFGEDAFHAMWFLLMREYHPLNCLEIGVYRGQVISLWAMIAKELNIPCNIHGISPFTPAGDQVSVYLKNIDSYLNL